MQAISSKNNARLAPIVGIALSCLIGLVGCGGNASQELGSNEDGLEFFTPPFTRRAFAVRDGDAGAPESPFLQVDLTEQETVLLRARFSGSLLASWQINDADFNNDPFCTPLRNGGTFNKTPTATFEAEHLGAFPFDFGNNSLLDACIAHPADGVTPAPNTYMGNNWPSGTAFCDAFPAVNCRPTPDLDTYLQFEVQPLGPLGEYLVVPSTVVFSIFRETEGTVQWELRSSDDGYASALGSGVASQLTGAGSPFAVDVSSIGPKPNGAFFRLYLFGGTGEHPERGGIAGAAQGGLGVQVYGSVVAGQ